MKMNRSGIMLVLVALILGLSILAPVALAEGDPAIQIGAQITLEGALPKSPETFIIRMTANDSANPMPDGALGGSFDLSITGAGSAAFPIITYDRVGIYKYTVRQIAGANPGCKSYDARIYDLTISVINDDRGGIDAAVALRERGKEEKCDLAMFHNVYKTKVTPPGEITPTGVSDRWPLYLGGAAALIIAAIVIARVLRRREDGGYGGK